MPRADSAKFAQQRRVLRRYLNERVLDHFSDLSLSEIQNPTTERGEIANACFVTPSATGQNILISIEIFNVYVNGILDRDPVIGMPLLNKIRRLQVSDQVIFYWRETAESARDRQANSGGAKIGRSATKKQISIRLTPALLEQWASSESAVGQLQDRVDLTMQNHRFTLGRFWSSYRDDSVGLNTTARTSSEGEAREMYAKVLECFQLVPDYEAFMKICPPQADAYYSGVTVDELGESVTLPDREFTAQMYFSGANMILRSGRNIRLSTAFRAL